MTSYNTPALELVFTYGVVKRFRNMLWSDVFTRLRMQLQYEQTVLNRARDGLDELDRARDGLDELDRARDGLDELDRARDGLNKLELDASKFCVEFPRIHRKMLRYSRSNMYPGSNMWAHLHTLRRIAYEIEDMLDKAATSHLEQQVNDRSELLPPAHYIFKSRSAGRRMLAQLESISNLLDDPDPKLDSEGIFMGRKPYCRSSATWEEGTFIVGRDSEKEQIIDWIFNSNYQQQPTVICVHGDQGIGKTALAKMVYNHVLQVSPSSFDLVLWALAPSSSTSDLKSHVVEILRCFTDQSRFYLHRIALETLKHTLRGLLVAKKYLIVLDDYVGGGKLTVWEELMEILKVGLAGSIAIVTTKSKLATCTTKSLELQGLHEKDCWSLFTGWAGFKEDKCQLSRGIWISLVDKCGGCPLAIKTLGSMLHHANGDERLWIQINESKIWTTLGHEASAAAFRISIEYMQCELVQGLIVPLVLSSNRVMSKERLLHLLIAMGNLQSDMGNLQSDDVYVNLMDKDGSRLCNELLHSCAVELFQSTDGNDDMVLVRDHVSVLLDLIQKEVALLPGVGSVPLNRRHLIWAGSRTSFLYEELAACGFTLDEVRTFSFQGYVGPVTKFFLEDLISKLTHVRVMLLDGSEFEVLPESIGTLTCIKYLSLVGNYKLKALPESVCRLVGLQTLDLSGCEQLQKLPNDMHRLVSLRHLFLSMELTHVPEKAFQSWASLRHLTICNCPNLNSLSEGIAHLTALLVLQIRDCPLLVSLPYNLRSLTFLEELSILNCGMLDLTNWDGLQGLWCLQYLRLHGLPKVTKFPEGLHSAAYWLRRFVIRNCQNLTALPEWPLAFRQLEEMEIDNCPNVATLPIDIQAYEALQVLKIVNCPNLFPKCQKDTGELWPLICHIPKIQLLQYQAYQKRDISSLMEHTGPRCQDLPEKKELIAVTRLHSPPLFTSAEREHSSYYLLARGFLLEAKVSTLVLTMWCWLVSYICLRLFLSLLWGDRNIGIDTLLYTTKVELCCSAVFALFLLILVDHQVRLGLDSQVSDATRRVNEVCRDGIQNLRAKAGYGLFITLKLIKRFGKQDNESYAKGMLFLLGEGCEFEKDHLIQLWMAVGYVELEPMELNGANYFEKLVSQEYILHSQCKSMYKVNIEKVKSDLDKIRDKSSYLRLENISQSIDVAPAEILHVSVTSKDISDGMFKMLRKFNRLRTLLFDPASGSRLEQMAPDLFMCFEWLSVLDLSRTDIKELPSSTLKIIHLRYLDLSWTLIEFLPERISCLSRLQTLRLRGCSRLWKLPTEMKALVELRHLDFDVLGQLGAMPEGMGVLVSLRTLAAFIVNTQEGGKITELRDLNNLTGEFCVARLEHVQSADEAEMASLSTKKDLKTLDLRWSDFPLQQRSVQDVDEGVLESLCPHPNLEELLIRCYGGTNLPSWIISDSFHKLASITLFKCECLSKLPAMQNLPSLEHLELVGLNIVTEMDVRGEMNHVAFPSLQRLVIDEMDRLNTWKAGEDGDFPCLVEVTIKHCPKLPELPLLVYLSSLKRLEISSCPGVEFADDKQLSSSLEFLIVEECPLIKGNCLEEDGKIKDKIKHVKNVWVDQEDVLISTDDEVGDDGDDEVGDDDSVDEVDDDIDDDDHSELLGSVCSDINDE